MLISIFQLDIILLHKTKNKETANKMMPAILQHSSRAQFIIRQSLLTVRYLASTKKEVSIYRRDIEFTTCVSIISAKVKASFWPVPGWDYSLLYWNTSTCTRIWQFKIQGICKRLTSLIVNVSESFSWIKYFHIIWSNATFSRTSQFSIE